MKKESLVIVYQNGTVKKRSCKCTHRPSHSESWVGLKFCGPIVNFGIVRSNNTYESRFDNWDEVVTRLP